MSDWQREDDRNLWRASQYANIYGREYAQNYLAWSRALPGIAILIAACFLFPAILLVPLGIVLLWGGVTGFGYIREELQRALALEQGAALTHVLFGRVYDLKGMRQQADAAYRESERLDPRVYAQAQVANGAQMQAAGRLGDAVKQYRAATLTDPTYMEAFTRLGSACFENYQKVDAADAFRAATCLAPNDYSAHYLLGYTLLYQSQVNLKTVVFKRKVAPPDEAIKALLRAVDLDPNRTDAHFALGKAYEAAGVRHLAREQMERVLALDSNGRDAVSAREALRTLYQTDRARD